MSVKRGLLSASYFLFGIATGGIYAYVFDVEPLSAEKHYALEREIYAREHLMDYQSFPSFNEWMSEQEAKEHSFREYLNDLSDRLGRECADTFDWSEPMSAEQWDIQNRD